MDDSPGDKWHIEAIGNSPELLSGTHELIGPKVQKNPYGLTKYILVGHGRWLFQDEPPRTFNELKVWFETHEIEGIVWWRNINDQDCDKVKIKRKDFGLPWPVKK